MTSHKEITNAALIEKRKNYVYPCVNNYYKEPLRPVKATGLRVGFILRTRIRVKILGRIPVGHWHFSNGIDPVLYIGPELTYTVRFRE